MRILIGCEFSGVIRRSFAMRGHDATSCDLLPSDDNSPNHVICKTATEIFDLIASEKWDIGIFNPPCTYLCNSGVRWLYGGRGTVIDTKRWEAMEYGALFFKKLLNCRLQRVCVENSIMHKYAREIVNAAPSQIVQPYQFGVGETKATCLWLRGLPKLKPTNLVSDRRPVVHYASPGKDRWKVRSKTCVGIAEAMAEQWGNL